jgi:hypothetical protein
MYAGSNVIWRAVRYAGPPVQTLGAHLAPAPTLDMSFVSQPPTSVFCRYIKTAG